MRIQFDTETLPHFALEQYQPKPNILYSLDAAAHIAGVPRRSILIYCRAGLVQSVLLPPYGIMAFTEEAIHTVRRIKHARTVHGLDLTLLKTLFELRDEVERLRSSSWLPSKSSATPMPTSPFSTPPATVHRKGWNGETIPMKPLPANIRGGQH